jgi:hypothetical protein
MRPLILVDVDGVLNPDFRCHPPYCECHPGWRRVKVYPIGVQYQVYVNPLLGSWLTRLAADTGAELAWGTTWENHANDWIGPLTGLPVLPVAPVSGYGKATVLPWTAGRPFVWFDDDGAVAEICAAHDTPNLCVRVDPAAGLTEDDISLARDWLTQLAKEDRP